MLFLVAAWNSFVSCLEFAEEWSQAPCWWETGIAQAANAAMHCSQYPVSKRYSSRWKIEDERTDKIQRITNGS